VGNYDVSNDCKDVCIRDIDMNWFQLMKIYAAFVKAEKDVPTEHWYMEEHIMDIKEGVVECIDILYVSKEADGEF